MKIDVSKLNITLPEGVSKKTEPDLQPDGMSIKFTVTGDKEVSGNIGVAYNSGSPVNCKLTVQNAPVKEATLLKIADNILGVVAGKDFTVKAEFDMPPVLEKAKITVPSDWTVKEATKVEGNFIIAVYTTKNITDAAKISVTYGSVTKELTIRCSDPAKNTFLSMDSDKAEYNVGEDITLICNYKYDVTDEDKPELSGKTPEGVKEKTPLYKEGKTWKVVWTAETAGSKTFSYVAYKGQGPAQAGRNCTVTVK